MAHALLGASSSHRWLECTPSAMLEASEPNECSQYAEEGTDAHDLAGHLLEQVYKIITVDELNKWFEEFTSKSQYYSAEMMDYVMVYVEYIKSITNELKNQGVNYKVLVEQRVCYDNFVEEGFGTADCIILADNYLHIVDLKYGKGVPVTAQHNSQLMLYAIGAARLIEKPVPGQTVAMTIVQPRLNSIDTFYSSISDLLNWGRDEVYPKAQLAAKGWGKFNPGEHQCRFCKLRGKCKAAADLELKRAQDLFEIVPSSNDEIRELSPEKLAMALDIGDEYRAWIEAAQKYAYQYMIDGGQIPGYKLVEGRSNRVITDDEKVIEILTDEGFDMTEILKPSKLQGITELERLVGKKKFNELCSSYVIKPPGKVSIAKEADNRPEYSLADRMVKYFD